MIITTTATPVTMLNSTKKHKVSKVDEEDILVQVPLTPQEIRAILDCKGITEGQPLLSEAGTVQQATTLTEPTRTKMAGTQVRI